MAELNAFEQVIKRDRASASPSNGAVTCSSISNGSSPIRLRPSSLMRGFMT